MLLAAAPDRPDRVVAKVSASSDMQHAMAGYVSPLCAADRSPAFCMHATPIASRHSDRQGAHGRDFVVTCMLQVSDFGLSRALEAMSSVDTKVGPESDARVTGIFAAQLSGPVALLLLGALLRRG